MAEPDLHTVQRNRRRMALIYWSAILFIFIIFFLAWWFVWRLEEYTNDAYVEGNQVYITPLKPGFIQAIHTDDTFLVNKGQLLVELDRTDAIIALEQSKNELAKVVREVCQKFHQVFIYQAEIEIQKAELIKTEQDLQHRLAVIDAAGISLEDLEHAQAAYRSSFFALQRSEVAYKKALAFVQGTSITTHPVVLAAADQLRNYWVLLYRSNIYSPVEGLAAQRKAQVGMWVKAGEPLLSVIPLDQIWVNANFKETQLKYMRIGQSVKLTSDLYGDDVIFNGIVVGLPGGAGNAFSLLPPQNLSGNWIKIVQRLPVRVALDPDELRQHPLRVGLSMEATVNLRDQEGRLVPVSNQGSPQYDTSIYEKEERGDEGLIQEIIKVNLDPTLAEFIDRPLVLHPSCLTLLSKEHALVADMIEIGKYQCR